MSEVKSVDLVLENCEYITLDKSELYGFDVDGIRANVSRRACNSISKYSACDEIFISMPPGANHTYSSFGGRSEDTIFQRLERYHDITAIHIYYEDGSEDYVLVPWNDEDEYHNAYQSSFISDCGWLYMRINKNASVMQRIDLDEANSEDQMAFVRSMCDLA